MISKLNGLVVIQGRSKYIPTNQNGWNIVPHAW